MKHVGPYDSWTLWLQPSGFGAVQPVTKLADDFYFCATMEQGIAFTTERC